MARLMGGWSPYHHQYQHYQHHNTGNQLNYPAYDNNHVGFDYQDFGELPQEPPYYQHYNEEMEISTETYPNALHVLKLNISTLGTGGHKPHQDQANDIDGYGSPEGPVISFNDFNVNHFGDEDISDNDNDVATIPQIPSSNVPDQENPERYVNNEIETINKVLDNPIFYYEPSY